MKRSSFVGAASALSLPGGVLSSRSIAAAAAAPRIALRVGALPLDASAQAFYAQDAGFFQAGGLDVSLTVLGNGASLLAALSSGQLDIGLASAAPLILARENGVPIRFLSPGGIFVGPAAPEAAIVVLKGSTAASPADFQGKTIAVAGIKNFNQFCVQAWLERAHTDPNGARFVEMPYSTMMTALEQNRIAAACQVEPFLTAARQTGQIIASLDEVIGNRYLISGWVANDDWPQRNLEAATRFAGVMQRVARWANGHRKESAAILVKYTKLDPEIAGSMTRIRYDGSERVDPALLQEPLNIMVKYGKVSPRPASDYVWSPESR